MSDPTQSEDILLNIAPNDVATGRPVMFGDVFADVACSRGGDAEDLVMVVSHPCSMRRGAVMKDRVLTARVGDLPQKVQRHKWVTGFFDYFPIVVLDQDGGPSVAADFSELHSANSAELDVQKRVLALSDYGVTVLLQRWIFQMSRDPVPLADLEALIAPVMAEAELQELWCEAQLRDKAPECYRPDTLAEAGASFQEFLGKRGDGGIRDQLQDPAKRGAARRSVWAEIVRRFKM